MPSPYQFSSGDVREPSIRPMSSELKDHNIIVPSRHFASWTNMRHYYRMYRNLSDATATSGAKGSGGLSWDGSKPWTDVACAVTGESWTGSNTYWRMPVLAKLTFIYSLQSIEITPKTVPKTYKCYILYTPIYSIQRKRTYYINFIIVIY